MHIDEYSAGHIVIDGKAYEGDVIIFSDHVFNVWWRKQGHRLQLSDMEQILSAKPEKIVVGTGYAECMKVDKEVIDECAKRGIELFVLETRKAVEKFNSLQGKVIAGLHLTC